MSNPYELRFKLLEMAQSYLQEQQQRNQDFVYNAWDLAKEQGNAKQNNAEDKKVKQAKQSITIKTSRTTQSESM